MGVLQLLAACLLTHLPCDLRDAACRTTAADEADRRVTALDFIWDIKHLNLSRELFRLSESGVLLVICVNITAILRRGWTSPFENVHCTF